MSRAAELLGCSIDTVRRLASAGQLETTEDTATIAAAAGGRGRPPSMLISLASVEAALESQVLASTRGLTTATNDVVDRLLSLDAEVTRLKEELAAERSDKDSTAALRDEVTRLRAELSKVREVARLSLIADAHLADAERVRRDQLQQFLTPDFIDD